MAAVNASRAGSAFQRLIAVALTGCGFGPECSQITVRGPATTERAGVVTPVALHGGVHSSLLYEGIDRFETTWRFLIQGGAASSSATVAWSFGSLPETGFWTIGLRGPRAEGEVVPVTGGSFDLFDPDYPDFWGPMTRPLNGQAHVAFRAAGLDATPAAGGSLSGTLAVRQVRPLSLTADLVAEDAEGEQLRLRGDLTFEGVDVVCP